MIWNVNWKIITYYENKNIFQIICNQYDNIITIMYKNLIFVFYLLQRVQTEGKIKTKEKHHINKLKLIGGDITTEIYGLIAEKIHQNN